MTTPTPTQDECRYSTVYGGERWCDTHDSSYPCAGMTGPGRTAHDRGPDDRRCCIVCGAHVSNFPMIEIAGDAVRCTDTAECSARAA